MIAIDQANLYLKVIPLIRDEIEYRNYVYT